MNHEGYRDPTAEAVIKRNHEKIWMVKPGTDEHLHYRIREMKSFKNAREAFRAREQKLNK